MVQSPVPPSTLVNKPAVSKEPPSQQAPNLKPLSLQDILSELKNPNSLASKKRNLLFFIAAVLKYIRLVLVPEIIALNETIAAMLRRDHAPSKRPAASENGAQEKAELNGSLPHRETQRQLEKVSKEIVQIELQLQQIERGEAELNSEYTGKLAQSLTNASLNSKTRLNEQEAIALAKIFSPSRPNAKEINPEEQAKEIEKIIGSKSLVKTRVAQHSINQSNQRLAPEFNEKNQELRQKAVLLITQLLKLENKKESFIEAFSALPLPNSATPKQNSVGNDSIANRQLAIAVGRGGIPVGSRPATPFNTRPQFSGGANKNSPDKEKSTSPTPFNTSPLPGRK